MTSVEFAGKIDVTELVRKLKSALVSAKEVASKSIECDDVTPPCATILQGIVFQLEKSIVILTGDKTVY